MMVHELRCRGRVVLVDDDEQLRTMVGKYLKRSGYEVREFGCPEEVLQAGLVGSDRFDVLVSDVHMPGMSGIDLAGLLLELQHSQPIVLMTGDPNRALASEALARGPISYLLKPFEFFELKSAVETALARQSQHEMLLALAGRSDATGVRSLELADRASSAGVGHTDRVGRIARALAAHVGLDGVDVSHLTVAAWMHELGALQLPRPSAPHAMAVRSAAQLQEMGCSGDVARFVEHMHERWDGAGGPDGLAGDAIPAAAQLLGLADALDHYTSAWLQTGTPGDTALQRALELVKLQAGAAFAPRLARAATELGPKLRTLYGLGVPGTILAA